MPQKVKLRELPHKESMEETVLRHFKNILSINHLQEFSTASIFPLPANSTSVNTQDAGLRHINSSLPLHFIIAAFLFAELSH